MQTRKRHKDGAGKGPNSWKKHFLVERALIPQVAILTMKFGQGGLIVDMHAGDGQGIDEPQGDLFGTSLSHGTAAIAVRAAAKWKADVVLCESVKHRRDLLRDQFGEQARILHRNGLLPSLPLGDYPWLFLINDPNGPTLRANGHAPELLQTISKTNPRSDFIVCVNEGALSRLDGVNDEGEDEDKPNAKMIHGCRKYKDAVQWMRDPMAWGRLLHKKHGAYARSKSCNAAYHGRILLLSNYVGNLNPEIFAQW